VPFSEFIPIFQELPMPASHYLEPKKTLLVDGTKDDPNFVMLWLLIITVSNFTV